MPEQLTKHPEATLQLLRDAGARCGEVAQTLTACPAERLCKLPGGEICVYGVGEAARMTQFEPADWQTLAGLAPSVRVEAPGASAPLAPVSPPAALASAVGLVLIGVAIGWMLKRR